MEEIEKFRRPRTQVQKRPDPLIPYFCFTHKPKSLNLNNCASSANEGRGAPPPPTRAGGGGRGRLLAGVEIGEEREPNKNCFKCVYIVLLLRVGLLYFVSSGIN